MKRIVSNKLYMMTLISDNISNFGDIIFYVALLSYVLQIPETKLAVALIGISEMVPVILGTFLGYLADRYPKKVDGILATQFFRAILYIVLGLLLGLTPSFGIVLLAILINLFSDMSGIYENALFYPVSLRLVRDEERAQAMGLSTALSQTGRIIFNSVGAVLLTWFTYQEVAFINAATFVIAALFLLIIRNALSALFLKRPLQAEKQSHQSNLTKDFFYSLRMAVKELFRIPILKESMMIAPLINAIGSGVSVLYLLMLKDHPESVFISHSISIAALSVALGLGNILGSLTVNLFFKKMTLKKIFISIMLSYLLIYYALIIQNSYLVLLGLFLGNVMAGALNPKMMALVYNHVPEESLGVVFTGMTTYFSLGMVVFQSMLSGLILVLPMRIILLCLIFLCFSLLGYTMTIKSVEV